MKYINDLTSMEQPVNSEESNFIIQNGYSTKKINFTDLKNSIVTEFPYNGAREITESWNEIKTLAGNGWIGSNIRVGDYKKITLTNGITFTMEVAGIDTYSSRNNHYIDFISREVYSSATNWTTASDNNVSVTTSGPNQCPYFNSSIKNYLNNDIYDLLPTDLKDVIVNKALNIEIRKRNGTSSGAIETSTGHCACNIGKLWIPTEFEVLGKETYGTLRHSSFGQVQYPIFRDGLRNRIKINSYNGTDSWWTATVVDGNTTAIVCIDSSGYPTDINTVSTRVKFPLCFRIAGN